MYTDENGDVKIGSVLVTIGIVLVALFVLMPVWNRYQTLQNAKNELAAQQYLKQVAISAAEAKNESAKYEALAEVTRAEGVAKANAIIGDSLKENEAYLRYLWISNMNEAQKEVVYIPTEAGMPILEAGKR